MDTGQNHARTPLEKVQSAIDGAAEQMRRSAEGSERERLRDEERRQYVAELESLFWTTMAQRSYPGTKRVMVYAIDPRAWSSKRGLGREWRRRQAQAESLNLKGWDVASDEFGTTWVLTDRRLVKGSRLPESRIELNDYLNAKPCALATAYAHLGLERFMVHQLAYAAEYPDWI
jgi:hypothetical protein